MAQSSHYALAKMIERGQGGNARDPFRATELLQFAANAGNSDAQYEVRPFLHMTRVCVCVCVCVFVCRAVPELHT